MNDWERRRANEKRDKQLPLRASTNDFSLLDGLINDLKTSKKVPYYYKYSRMDLIVDALLAYKAVQFPEDPETVIVFKISDEVKELIKDLQAKRNAVNSRRSEVSEILSDCIRFASGKINF